MITYPKLRSVTFVCIVTISLALNSCEDSTPVGQKPNVFFSYTLGNETIYSRQDVMSNIDRPTLTGIIWLVSDFRSIYITGGDSAATGEFDGTDNDAFATFRQHVTSIGLSIGDIRLNNGLLQEDEAAGAYYYRHSASDSLDLLFGGGANRIVTNTSAALPSFDATIPFSAPVRMNGVARNQSISRNQSLTLTWNGSGNSYAEINISRKNVALDSTSLTGLLYITDDDGSFTLPTDIMQELSTGLTDISVRRTEPKYITLSDNRKVCFLGQSKHTVTVNIID